MIRLQSSRLLFVVQLLTASIILYILCSILYGQRLLNDWHSAAIALSILIPLFSVSWYLHVKYTTFITTKFPTLQQTKQRVLFRLAVNIVVMTPTLLLILFLFKYLPITKYVIKENDIRDCYLLGLSINIIFESLQEVIYLLNKYKENVAEEELLKQMQLEQEFENLKEKINPHFLFNCFNTLLYLIADNKVKAEIFLNELSKVYRYLLRNNENDVSTVEQEITFIKSYAGLLKTRFEEGFQLEVNINEKVKSFFLPSLTLQLLVENALKHNIASAKKPITVSIYSLDVHTIVVENTIAKKPSRVISTGIGLSSIKEKYRLLHNNQIHIEETTELFKVMLPLLEEQPISLQ